MTRKDFIKMCGILGIGGSLQTSLISCSPDDNIDVNFSGKVIIIGAGAGGLTAGYLLKQSGIDFEILEASAKYGGRMKINTNFADFPLPLGAEWLHTNTEIFKEIVNDDNVQTNVTTRAYDDPNDTYGFWENDELSISKLDDSDIKFVNYSWFNFFEEYIVPSVADKIVYNSIVQSIDYSGEKVLIQAQNEAYSADKVIVSVPLKILQEGDINFIPSLPDDKADAINRSTVWDGFKAFFEFTEKFYPTQTGFNITPETDGQKLYYDAAYGQNTSKNILGLFVVGQPALDYISKSDAELQTFILNELDKIFSNRATPNYVNHLVQNWNAAPFAKGAYLTDHADWRQVRTLSESVADKIYFAGGAYTSGEDWVAVQAAAQSAKAAVRELVS